MLLEDREKHFFRGAGVGGAFEDDQVVLFQIGRDGVAGRRNVAEVGFVVLIQRRGNGDDDSVDFVKAGVIRGRGKAVVPGGLNLSGQNPLDIRFAAVEGIDLIGVDIEAQNLELFL